MPEWLNAHFFTAMVIFYLINAVPSSLFGIALARRAGRPWWHGLLPAFFLPWLGPLFLVRQPDGEPHVTGPARYSMVMLFVAGDLMFVSIWMPWVSGSGTINGRPGSFEYSPNEVLLVAILVWLLALGMILSSIGLLFRGGFTVALVTGILVASMGGIIAVTYYLFGPAGLFLSEARAGVDLKVQLGAGAKLALVALVTAYVAVLVVPFGLKVRRVRPSAPTLQPQPPWHQPQPPQQPWGGGPGPGRPRPSGPGATW